jgi:hypothetical protein
MLLCTCIIPDAKSRALYLLYSNVHINGGVYLASRGDFYTEKTEILSGGGTLVLQVSILTP